MLANMDRRALLAGFFLPLLDSCGGDGCTICFRLPPDDRIQWDRPIYEMLVSPDGVDAVTCSARLDIQGFYADAVHAIHVEPSGASANPGAGDGPWPIVYADEPPSRGAAAVTLIARALGGPGSYPIGSFELTAELQLPEGTTREARAALVVRLAR